MNTRTLTISIPDLPRATLAPDADMDARADFELAEVDADSADIQAAHEELNSRAAALDKRRHSILRIIQETPTSGS